MKKSLIVLASFLGIASFSYAQVHVQPGVKAGVNVSNVHGNNFDYNPRTSFHAGGLLHIHLNKTWAIQPELVFSSQGSKYSNNGIDYRTKLDYLNIPALVQFMTESGFRVETGPQLGFLLSARSKANEGVNNKVTDQFRSADLSWALGAGFLFPSGFGIDARYNFGITEIAQNASANLRNNVFQVGLFYQFPALKHTDSK
ncbi:porin family protein [Pollutibacter soli]|uniref:porin family protein n=1 Tax=Pollutibacter soli TaxID=3034157 RepID=UPI0030139F1D